MDFFICLCQNINICQLCISYLFGIASMQLFLWVGVRTAAVSANAWSYLPIIVQAAL